MGDRGNIFLIDNTLRANNEDRPLGVFIYAHWNGSDLARLVRDALAKRWRWDDSQYLARIIYDTCVGDAFGKELSWGLSTHSVGDAEHPFVCVDLDNQEVYFADSDYYNPAKLDTPIPKPLPGKRWSFKDYVALSDKDLDKAFLWRG